MGRHHAFQAGFGQAGERHEVLGLDFLEGAVVHGGVEMGVGGHRAVSREMLGDRRHAGLGHALSPRRAQGGDGFGLAVKCAIADDRADAAVEVGHRGETQVDAAGAKFQRHGQRRLARALERTALIGIVQASELGHRRQRRKALREPLHPSALLVHRDEKPATCRVADLVAQVAELPGFGVVSREQDDAAEVAVAQQVPLLAGDGGAPEIGDYRAECRRLHRDGALA
ncbi:MAG: hypothetical protein M5U09_21690 [Gammaproteobacteria bacterium]|nr:hypothetical protein [Gammaproteobacteria bacterium]